MKSLLKTVLREIVGLFVDDGFLAVAILVVVAVAALIRYATGLGPMIAALALLGGCVLVLVVGVGRTARARASVDT